MVYSVSEFQWLNIGYVVMSESLASDKVHELHILEHLEQNPDLTQADLAVQLGVAVGTVNWYLKRLVRKGYIRTTQLQRRRMRYLLTPKGVAERAHLAVQYVRASMYMYRSVRQQARVMLQRLQQRGCGQVAIEGDGVLADVVRLTCLEQGVEVVTHGATEEKAAVIEIRDARLELREHD